MKGRQLVRTSPSYSLASLFCRNLMYTSIILKFAGCVKRRTGIILHFFSLLTHWTKYK